jgi:regulator of RNase E activity RraA
MTLGAKGRGAKGVVIVGGGVRDLREHREEGFPVSISLSISITHSLYFLNPKLPC